MAGERRPAAIPRVAALDGARGLAVAGVVLFHSGHLVGGYLGVDFFFTLSGFLITSLLLAESSRAGSIGLGGFWARRARRLLPALVVLMVGVAVYAVVWAKPTELEQIRGDALATLGYVANWHDVFTHTSYFALFASPSPLQHTWSLAIEEQFYLIWPLVFVALLARFRHHTPRAVLVVSLALAAVSSVLMVVLYQPVNTNRVYYGTDTRAAAILLGAALAAALTLRPIIGRRARVALEAVGVAGAVVLAYAWTHLAGESSTLYRGGFVWCGLAATAVIAAAVHPTRGPIARALSFRPLCALGLISYGVYLYHWPIDVILNEQRAHLHGWPLVVLQVAVTLAIATASYRFVEQPIRHGALSAARLRALTPAVAGAVVVMIITSTAGAVSPPQLVAVTPRQWLFFATAARVAAPVGEERVMIVGDSVAAYAGHEMRSLKTDPPVAVFNQGVSGCLFPRQVVAEEFDLAEGGVHERSAVGCNQTWQSPVIGAFQPQLVFLMLASPANRVSYQGRWIQPCSEPYASLFLHDVTSEIERVGADGAHVVVTTTAYAANDFSGTNRFTDCNNRLLDQAARTTNAQLIDLFHYVCPDGKCRKTLHGVTLRPDGLHYQGPGGQVIARWLLAHAAPAAQPTGASR